MDFSDLVTREIDQRFCYIKYDEFDLIMMKENGFINATKLCKLGGKDFHRWKRLDGSKELITKVKEMNGMWKSGPPRSGGGIIIEVNGANQYTDYDIAGSYVHQDLIPHITSWISPFFAVKVSKIINCYLSGKYELKLKKKEQEIVEKEITNKELLELLQEFNRKYDKDTLELKERYRELKKYNKRMEEKYDRDTRELKEHNKRMEEKYDRDTKELKTELKKIEERLKDKVINPSSPDKLHRLVILQKKNDSNSFRTLRVQAKGLDRELDKVKRDYRVFFNAYEPNAVSCFNRLKERLLEQERVKINYNDFTLCDLENYGVRELYNDLQNLDLVRKYA
ncbi:KilA N domain protein [Finch poxvirus]|uniref:KilA N domain protein n=1 Tax=Condorpox virus TaxID=3049970 RepID=A0AAT9UQ09_9POXV|nr:KilA N domain protein [Finch poxvirus]UOX38976.1 KilA N domain protein [Finch poxvirus]